MDRKNIKDLMGRWRFNSQESQIERSRFYFERRATNTERGTAGSIGSNAGRWFVAKTLEGSRVAVIRMRYTEENPAGRPAWCGSEHGAKKLAERLPGEWEWFKAPADNSQYMKTRAFMNPHANQWFWLLPEDKEKEKAGKQTGGKTPVIRVWAFCMTGVSVYGPSSMDGLIVGSVLKGTKKIGNLQAVMDGLIDPKDIIPKWEDPRNEETYNAKWGVDSSGNQKHWFHGVKWPETSDSGGKKNKSIRKKPVGRSSTSIAELQKLIDNS